MSFTNFNMLQKKLNINVIFGPSKYISIYCSTSPSRQYVTGSVIRDIKLKFDLPCGI